MLLHPSQVKIMWHGATFLQQQIYMQQWIVRSSVCQVVHTT
jgi:hypothetical protein